MSTKSQGGYVTFIAHCPECHQRLSPGEPGNETTIYSHENSADCSGEGKDVELPTVTVSQMTEAFGVKKAAPKKKAK